MRWVIFTVLIIISMVATIIISFYFISFSVSLRLPFQAIITFLGVNNNHRKDGIFENWSFNYLAVLACVLSFLLRISVVFVCSRFSKYYDVFYENSRHQSECISVGLPVRRSFGAGLLLVFFPLKTKTLSGIQCHQFQLLSTGILPLHFSVIMAGKVFLIIISYLCEILLCMSSYWFRTVSKSGLSPTYNPASVKPWMVILRRRFHFRTSPFAFAFWSI